MAEITELFTRASAAFSEKIDSISDDQWDRETPCSDWDVRALVNHVVGENFWIAPLFEGKTIADVGDRYEGDVLGDDPKSAWKQAAGESIAAILERGSMERTVHLSYGDEKASEYSKQLITDLVVHGWDLARGIGADDKMDPELAGIVYEWALPNEKMLASMPQYFSPPIETPEAADVQTKLLHLLGRET